MEVNTLSDIADYVLERLCLSLFFVLPQDQAQLLSLELDYEDFASIPNQRLLTVFRKVVESGAKVEPAVVDAQININRVDIPDNYIDTIYNSREEADITNLSYYIETLKKYALVRRLYDVGGLLQHIDPNMSQIDIIEVADGLVTGAIDAEKAAGIEKVGGNDFETRVLNRIDNPVEILGIKTGLSFFDATFDGIVPTLLTLVGGRPGTGKSALGQNIVFNVGIKQQVPLLLIDTETNIRFVEDRLLAISSGVDYNHILHGNVSKEIMQKHIEIIQGGNIYYHYMPDLNPKELMMLCRKYQKAYGIQAVIVDFLGAPSGNDDKGHIELGRKVKAMHDIAGTLELGFVVFQQLNREQLDKTTGKTVKEIELGHFAQSDMSTWYPDGIAGLRLPTTVEKSKFQCDRMVDCPKARFSEPGISYPLTFVGNCLRFEDVNVF